MEYHLHIIVTLYVVSTCVAENIAMGKPANQTGTWYGLTADKAVDGHKDSNTNGITDYYRLVCAHPDTGYPSVPAKWWVYLGDTYTISTITVYNTYISGGSVRMKYFEAGVQRLGYDDISCGQYRDSSPVPPGGNTTFTCNGTVGQIVYVAKIPGYIGQHLLALCEVEVDGSLNTAPTSAPILTPQQLNIDNIAYQRPTSQTGTSEGMTSELAVDGYADILHNTLINCARIDNPTGQAAEWWVNLEQLYRVESIVVYNTWDISAYNRLTNFKLLVSNTSDGLPSSECSSYQLTVGRGYSLTMNCPPDTIGQYVHFVRVGVGSTEESRPISRVTLCEVEVFGRLVDLAPADYSTQNYGVQLITSSSITIEWQQLTITSGTDTFYKYNIRVTLRDSDQLVLDKIVSHEVGSTDKMLMIDNLSYNTHYDISINPYRIINGEPDYGTPYPSITAKTHCIDPDEPMISTIITQYTPGELFDKIVIRYQIFAETGCDNIMSLKIIYQPQGGAEINQDISDTSSSTGMVTITPTSPGTYYVKLRITNNGLKESQSNTREIEVKMYITSSVAPSPSSVASPTPVGGAAVDMIPDHSTKTSPTPVYTSAESTQTTSSVIENLGEDEKDTSQLAVIVIPIVIVLIVVVGIIVVIFMVLRHRRKTPAPNVDSDHMTTGQSYTNGAFVPSDLGQYQALKAGHIITNTKNADLEPTALKVDEPGDYEVIPADNDDGQVYDETLPSNSDGTPSNPDETPLNPDETPSNPDETPSNPYETLAKRESATSDYQEL